jgi:hypothetical protein
MPPTTPCGVWCQRVRRWHSFCVFWKEAVHHFFNAFCAFKKCSYFIKSELQCFFFFYYFVFWLLVFCKLLEPQRWFILKWIPLSMMLIFHFHHGCWIWAEIMWYFYSYWSGVRVCPLYCNCHWSGDSSLDDGWMIVRYWRVGTWCVAAVAPDVFVLWECGALVKWYWQKTKEPWEQPDVLPVCLFTTDVVWTGLALKCNVIIILCIALPDIQKFFAVRVTTVYLHGVIRIALRW